jgi:hypothetical protein
MFMARMFSAERKCLCGVALIDNPRKHRGRPRTSHTDDNCVTVENLIKEERRIKIHEISEVTDIARNIVHEIISYLSFRKISAR